MKAITVVIDPLQYQSYKLVKDLVKTNILGQVNIINILQRPCIIATYGIAVLPAIISDAEVMLCGIIKPGDIMVMLQSHKIQVDFDDAKQRLIKGILLSAPLSGLIYVTNSLKCVLENKILTKALTGLRENHMMDEFIKNIVNEERNIINNIMGELMESILRYMLKVIFFTYKKKNVSRVDVIEFFNPSMLMTMLNFIISYGGLITYHLNLKNLQVKCLKLYQRLHEHVEELYKEIVNEYEEIINDKEYQGIVGKLEFLI